MEFEIGKSYADIEVLLNRLTGRHIHGKSDRYSSIVLAVFMSAILPYGAFSLVRSERPGVGEVIAGVTIGLVGPLFAVAIIRDAYATFDISPIGIRKLLPVRGVAWNVSAADIHSITLEFQKAWQLRVKTTGDKVRRVPLFGSLRVALASLYPEIGSSDSVVLPKTWGYVAYVVLAVVLICTVAALWILAARGLVSWK
jgi:hypothetical protein